MAHGRDWLGVAGYVVEQIRLVTDGLVKPHRLIRARDDDDDYYVTVASVAGLDTAIANSGVTAGRLVVQVLPTATLSDCRVFKDAAEAGEYRGLDFVLLATETEGDDPVDANLVSSMHVVDARHDLEDALASLAALEVKLTAFGRVSQGTRARPGSRPGAATRAALGSQQWERHINRARTDVLQSLRFNIDRLRAGQARLISAVDRS